MIHATYDRKCAKDVENHVKKLEKSYRRVYKRENIDNVTKQFILTRATVDMM